jgi:RHS repeat-associated protein
MTDDEGEIIDDVMKYYPYGDRLESEANLPTDRLFTGQRYDDTGLYHYGARYYDPEIGRFISPDTIIPNPASPQSFNRYSYCMNNPLKYVDPSGHWGEVTEGGYTLDPRTGEVIFIYDLAEPYQPAWPAISAPLPESVPDISIEPGLPVENDNDIEWWAWCFVGVLILDDFVGVVGDDLLIPYVLGGATTATFVDALQGGSDIIVKVDKLSDWEVERLEEILESEGEDLHSLKSNKRASKREYYHDDDGEIYVTWKGGRGYGEPTGYNIRDLRW